MLGVCPKYSQFCCREAALANPPPAAPRCFSAPKSSPEPREADLPAPLRGAGKTRKFQNLEGTPNKIVNLGLTPTPVTVKNADFSAEK